MERLTAAGFASTARVIEGLPIEAADKAKLQESILLDHRALAAGPGTPAATEAAAAATVKSEAPTPAAERDGSPIIAKMAGRGQPQLLLVHSCSFLHGRGDGSTKKSHTPTSPLNDGVQGAARSDRLCWQA